MDINETISFLTPRTAIWVLPFAIVALVALARGLWVRRRLERAFAVRYSYLGALNRVLAILLVSGLVAVGLMQPIVRSAQRDVRERNDVEVICLVDNGGSMAASVTADAPTRLDRARAACQGLLEVPELQGVPIGVATFLQHPQLHLPATADATAVVRQLYGVVVINNPLPPTGCKGGLCTSLQGAREAVERGFFRQSPETTTRVLIVLTDGESRNTATDKMRETFAEANVTAYVVDFWDADEAIFLRDEDGTVSQDRRYRPDFAAREVFENLVSAFSGRYTERELPAFYRDLAGVIGAAPDAAEDAPVIAQQYQMQELAPRFYQLAALVALLFVLGHGATLLRLKRARHRELRKQ